jgi:pimeloyl-ACP methyl ester carboxylesterase
MVVLYNLISSFGSKPAPAAMLEHMARAQFSDDELLALTVPVGFVAAENDAFCPPGVMASAQKRFRDAPLRVLPDAGHSAYYEMPEQWNSAVLALADELAPAADTARDTPQRKG